VGEPDRLDRIHIRGLRMRCVVGFQQWEREKTQEISVSVTLHLDLREAGKSDRVEDSVDYKALKKRLIPLVEGSKFYLIERLAEVIAGQCLKEKRVERVDVIVDKLGALRFADSVAVEITRTRDEGEARGAR
jgi:FolB domain-containing protein